MIFGSFLSHYRSFVVVVVVVVVVAAVVFDSVRAC